MNYNKQPKSEYVASTEQVAAHKRLVEDPVLQYAISVALLEMSRQITNAIPAENMGACAAAHLRMLGAQDFVGIFLNLAETQAAQPVQDTSNLPSNVQKMPSKRN